jgi:hypothetical protein
MDTKKTLFLIFVGLALFTTLAATAQLGAAVIIGESLLVLIVLVLVLIGALIASERQSKLAWALFMLISGVLVINSLYLFVISGRQGVMLFVPTAAFSISALIASLFGLSAGRVKEEREHPPEDILVSGIQPKKQAYIAAIDGKKYHAPGCRLAKRIKEESKVWFVNKGEAENKKYEPCSVCIE